MHPCRGEPDVLEQLLSLTGRDSAFEMGDTGGRHMILARFADGLDQNTAQAPGQCESDRLCGRFQGTDALKNPSAGGDEGVRNEEQGNSVTDSGLFSFAVEGSIGRCSRRACRGCSG